MALRSVVANSEYLMDKARSAGGSIFSRVTSGPLDRQSNQAVR
jgi:hypothetical protein